MVKRINFLLNPRNISTFWLLLSLDLNQSRCRGFQIHSEAFPILSCIVFYIIFNGKKLIWDSVRFLNRWYKKNSQNETRFRVFTRLYIVCVNDMSQCKNTQLFVLFYLVSFILSSFLVWIVYSLSLFLSFIRFICKFTQIFNTSIPFAMWMYFEFIWTDSDIICEHSIDT